MFDLVLAGKIVSEPRQTFALKDAADAHRALEVARDDRRDGAAALNGASARVARSGVQQLARDRRELRRP